MSNSLAPLTDEEIEEMKKQYALATGGPWKSYVEGRDHVSGSSFIMTVGEDPYVVGASAADQDFIASAHQNLPRLIAEVERLKSSFSKLFYFLGLRLKLLQICPTAALWMLES